jgi:RimJ/RimL family protein N-acetyltransferase
MQSSIRLRPVEVTDLPWVYMMQTDPESNAMAVTRPRTEEAFYQHWQSVLGDAAIAPRVILYDETPVGIISLFQRDGENHAGYWIERAYWGRGIASRAMQLFLEEVPTRPMIATAATSNSASLKVLANNGFVIEEVSIEPESERYPSCEVARHILG